MVSFVPVTARQVPVAAWPAPGDTIKKSWTLKYMTWIKEQVHFEQEALEATLLDYVLICRIPFRP